MNKRDERARVEIFYSSVLIPLSVCLFVRALRYRETKNFETLRAFAATCRASDDSQSKRSNSKSRQLLVRPSAFDCEDASKMDASRSICERHSAVSTRYANRSLVRNAALARPGVTRYGRRNTITSSSTGVARSGAHVQQPARPARSRMKRRNIVFRQAFLPPPASFASSRAR